FPSRSRCTRNDADLGARTGKLSSYKKEVFVVLNRLPATDNRQPITGNRQPTTDNRQPLPATDNRLPATDNRLPATDNQQLIYETSSSHHWVFNSFFVIRHIAVTANGGADTQASHSGATRRGSNNT